MAPLLYGMVGRAHVVWAVATVSLLVLVACFCRAALARQALAMSGLWVGETQFLAEAKLRDFQLFLAPPDPPARGGARVRQGYLIMVDLDGNFVANGAVSLAEQGRGRRLWASARAALDPLGAYRDARAVLLLDQPAAHELPSAPPLPSALSLCLGETDGTLTLSDGAKLYAFLAKDYNASAAAIAAWVG